MRSGITRRWLRGNLLITVLLVLLAETMFLYNYTRSYYNSVQQTMYRRFSSVSGQLKMYTGDTVQSTAATRSVALRRMVEQFADKDKYEFMLLDSYGGVIASSSGTNADGIVTGIDFEQAQEASDGLGVAVYRTQSGELVMAACYLVPYAAEDVAAMRLVTSLTLVGAQIKNAIAVSVVIAAVILAFTVMSGLYFIRSIVVPLGQVERTAASIARGELDVRLPVTGDEHDEVDRLRGTINQMAEGLEETEKMKNEFISSVSHELRTPLTSIRGWVETLRTLDDPADENYRKGLEIINNETGRLYNMVEELLDFSRLQNGRIRMDCRPLDLVAELTDAVLFCEARIQREGSCAQLHRAGGDDPGLCRPGPSAAGVHQHHGQRHQILGPRRAHHGQAVGGRIQGLCGDHRSGPRHPAGRSGKRQDQVLQGQQLGAGQRHRPGAGGFHHDCAGRHHGHQEHAGPRHGGHTGLPLYHKA